MKTYQSILAAFVCSVVASVAFTASAQAGKQGYATVQHVQGNVTYSLGAGQPEHPLVAGKYLSPGSIIFTKDNGIVDIVLGARGVDVSHQGWTPDRISAPGDSPVSGYISYQPRVEQNVIRLTPNSALAIDKLTVVDTGTDSVSDTELDLKKGKIFASVKKLSGASQYIVKLPNGVAGVRGTKFSIDIDGTVACFESTGGGVVLALTFPDGSTKTFDIQPGQFLDASSGGTTPLSPQLTQILNDIFKVLLSGTAGGNLNFGGDWTKDHVSGTVGNTHGHGH